MNYRLNSSNCTLRKEWTNSRPPLAVDIMINGAKYSRHSVSSGMEVEGGHLLLCGVPTIRAADKCILRKRFWIWKHEPRLSDVFE